jgi:indolepyruvate ferredoxin oxidoreductase alpha subunit
VEYVRTIDPYEIKEASQVIREALHHDGLAVVISKRACPLLLRKEGGLRPVSHNIDQDKCIHCYTCVSKLSCPALFKRGEEVHIDAALCIGCGCCSQVCPKQAIGVVD